MSKIKKDYFDFFETDNLDYTDYFKDKIRVRTQPVNIELKNILNIDSLSNYIDESFLIDYTLDNTETSAYITSKKLYGKEDYWWLICLINNLNNPFDWYLNNKQLYKFAEYLFNKEHKYTSVDTYYKLLIEWNEEKKNIKIVDKSQLTNIFNNFKKRV